MPLVEMPEFITKNNVSLKTSAHSEIYSCSDRSVHVSKRWGVADSVERVAGFKRKKE